MVVSNEHTRTWNNNALIIDIKIIILNNNLGMVRNKEMFFNKRYSFTDIQNLNFIKIA